jgi:enoyl-CoA hydratase
VWVVLDAPERRNALDSEALRALAETVHRLAADPKVALVGLRAEGDHFCAGADIDELRRLDSAAAAREHARLGQAACNALEQAPVPVVAAIQGYCVGGGLELAMSCDIRLATPEARFGQVELAIGSIAAWGGIRRLPRLVGAAVAKDLVFSARHIDAAEAVARGLISDVVDGDLLKAAEQRTEHLLSAPRLALAASKRALDHWVDVPLAAGLEDDRETFARLMEGEEFQGGVRRFLARSGR